VMRSFRLLTRNDEEPLMIGRLESSITQHYFPSLRAPGGFSAVKASVGPPALLRDVHREEVCAAV
jgi:hypothetical protein